MADQNRDYAALRRRVEHSLKRQKQLYRLIFFGTHLVFFLISMAIVWGVVLTDSQLRQLLFSSGTAASAVVIVPTILWAVVILFHIASLYTETSTAEKAMREQLLMREIGEDILRQGRRDQKIAEKPKRGAALEEAEHSITRDDGELPLDELLDGHGDSASHAGKS